MDLTKVKLTHSILTNNIYLCEAEKKNKEGLIVAKDNKIDITKAVIQAFLDYQVKEREEFKYDFERDYLTEEYKITIKVQKIE